jgi:hypothetical protein
LEFFGFLRRDFGRQRNQAMSAGVALCLGLLAPS